MLEVRLLGTFDIKVGKKVVILASRPAQSLFAFLVLNAGIAFRREKLAGQLWPESTEEQARDYLRHALWRIRKSLQAASAANFLKADDLTIAFDASAHYRSDAAGLLSAADETSIVAITAAVEAYQGELLPGFYDEWAVLEREHLQAVYEQVMARLVEALQVERRWGEVATWSERWIALGQRPEAAYRGLMSAYAAQGDMARAAAAYERCIKSLAEYGVQPSEQTRSLFERLRSGKQAFATLESVQGAKAKARPASNLPVPLTNFIGRKQEVSDITRLLTTQRLVTLVGPGGVGKTRLAIESASHVVNRYGDGVYWIDLVGLSDGALIPQELAHALNLREFGRDSVDQSVRDHLRLRQVLVVFDNCEHLIAAIAQYAQDLLAACEGVRILATSRERLGLFHEAAWQVPPLSQSAGIQLFCERALAAQRGFALSDSNRDAVLQICLRLDGIPLAIELAAARMALLSAEEVAARLDDRFTLLTAGSRGALPRHQTLRATIDWSHELLGVQEQLLFCRLSVFAGGFDLPAAETVCANVALPSRGVLDTLGRLVDKSLVVAHRTDVGGTRYGLLETIRQYAAEKLEARGEGRSIRDQHLEFYTKLAEKAEPELFGARQFDWFERLEAEIDNLRSALDWSATPAMGDSHAPVPARLSMGMRLAGALRYFWERNYRQEAIKRIRHILSLSDASGGAAAWAWMALGFLHWASTQQEAARPCLERAVALAEASGDIYATAWSRGYLGGVLIALGEYSLAKGQLEAALESGKQLPELGGNIEGWALGFLGDVPFAQGDNEAAKLLYRQALDHAKDASDFNSMTYSSRRLGYLAIREGKWAEAEEFFLQSLNANQKIGHLQGINRCLAAFAGLRAAQGRLLEAVQLCAAVESFMQQTSASFFHWDESFFNEVLGGLRATVAEPAFKKAWNKGCTMTLEQAVEFATSVGH